MPFAYRALRGNMVRIAGLGLVVVTLCSAQEGTRVFIARCIQCHDPNSNTHAPLPEALAAMPWENILKSLETGTMKAQGAQLPPEDRIAVARYLGKVESSTPPA